MPIDECMKKHTHRQYLVWQAWLRSRWNHKSKQDHYLAQIAAEVARLRADKPLTVKIASFFIPFIFRKKTEEEQDPEASWSEEDKIAISKSRWFGVTGYKGKATDGS